MAFKLRLDIKKGIKEINTPEDLKGLGMRIGGLGGRVMSKVGANTQVIPGNEVFVALSRGRIDAAEYGMPEIDYSLQMHKAAKYYYYPGWHQPASVNSLEINKDQWNKLTETQQKQIEAACQVAMLWSLNENAAKQLEALEKMKQEEGIIVKRFPDAVLAALKQAADEVAAEERKNDPIFDEAYGSLQDYIQKNKEWATLQSVEVAD